ncbi:hypothetical protein Tco_0375145 [Tanacetum coccineum]
MIYNKNEITRDDGGFHNYSGDGRINVYDRSTGGNDGASVMCYGGRISGDDSVLTAVFDIFEGGGVGCSKSRGGGCSGALTV